MGDKRKGKGKRKAARRNRVVTSHVGSPSNLSVTVQPRLDCWWTFEQLKAWYKTKMVLVSPEDYWAKREYEYERITVAFHNGLKILEHWDLRYNPDEHFEVPTVTLRDEYIAKGKLPLQALFEWSLKEYKKFQTYEVSPSRTADIYLPPSTEKKIEDYKKFSHESMFNSPMSARGKLVLKEVFNHITQELGRGEAPQKPLRNALTGTVDPAAVSYPTKFISEEELIGK
jgi:hypothetical protein